MYFKGITVQHYVEQNQISWELFKAFSESELPLRLVTNAKSIICKLFKIYIWKEVPHIWSANKFKYLGKIYISHGYKWKSDFSHLLLLAIFFSYLFKILKLISKKNEKSKILLTI